MFKPNRLSKFIFLSLLLIPSAVFAAEVQVANPLAGLGITSLFGANGLLLFLFNWAARLAGIVATASIIVAGYKLIFNSGEKEAYKESLNRIKWSAAGLALILLAYVIVNIFVNTLTGRDRLPGSVNFGNPSNITALTYSQAE